MEKTKKSLFISGGEIARIEIKNNDVNFLLCNDYGIMEEVNHNDLKKFLIESSYMFITSYDKNLTKNYIEFVKYFDDISLPSKKFTYNKPSKEIKF